MLEHLIFVNHIAISNADKNFIKDLIAGERRYCDPCVPILSNQVVLILTVQVREAVPV